jgi:hypothetical protein
MVLDLGDSVTCGLRGDAVADLVGDAQSSHLDVTATSFGVGTLAKAIAWREMGRLAENPSRLAIQHV